MTTSPRHAWLLALLTSVALVAGCATAPAIDPALRPATWATPLAVAGVGNLHRVDAHVYRSQQPTADGLRNVRAQLGVRTVVNLRAFHSDRRVAAAAGLRDEELHVNTWHIEDADVIRVLRILRQRENGPFLLHCQHGADRTGLMTAMYRIVEQGWTREEAIDEMLRGGYGFHTVWANLPAYLRKVDIGRIRAAVESTPGTPSPGAPAPAGSGPGEPQNSSGNVPPDRFPAEKADFGSL